MSICCRKKKAYLVLIIIIVIIVCLSCWLFYTDQSYEGKVVYPLSKVKNDGANWVLSITEVGNENPLLIITDQQTLCDNKRDFKITLMQDVYWLTPCYFVRLFRNGNEIQSYPLLYLEQVEFGSIKPIS